MTTSEKLVIGFYGNGKSTNRYHMPFVDSRSEKIRVKTIYERRLGSSGWSNIPGVYYTDKVEELLADPEIQVVVAPLPPEAHYEVAKQIIKAGKHCVMEKPFTQTLAQAQELFDLAKEKGVMIQCYQNRRFDSDFLTVQKVIESGKLGKIQEVEMHFDYFRPEVPLNTHTFERSQSYLYNHACHTLDQVISYFGEPDRVHYDVRQLLGSDRMNDYFDLDLYFGHEADTLKVSVKSSFFRIKERPSFVVYGTTGMFIKEFKDRQEADLKKFYLPDHEDFGVDLPEHYGTLTYVDDAGNYHEEKVVSEQGDYARYYDALYETIMHGKAPLVTPEQTILQMAMLEEGIKGLK